ncbi:hypothetical protein NQZ68_028597 [Dissostichus eleginoides]|nr:hypothetical protein NQZ68_028597 [Dissostichus eleginoides]
MVAAKNHEEAQPNHAPDRQRTPEHLQSSPWSLLDPLPPARHADPLLKDLSSESQLMMSHQAWPPREVPWLWPPLDHSKYGTEGHSSGGRSRNAGPWLHLFGFASSLSVFPLVMSSAGLLAESTYRQALHSVMSWISEILVPTKTLKWQDVD